VTHGGVDRALLARDDHRQHEECSEVGEQHRLRRLAAGHGPVVECHTAIGGPSDVFVIELPVRDPRLVESAELRPGRVEVLRPEFDAARSGESWGDHEQPVPTRGHAGRDEIRRRDAGALSEEGHERLVLDLLSAGDGERLSAVAIPHVPPCLGQQVRVGRVSPVHLHDERLAGLVGTGEAELTARTRQLPELRNNEPEPPQLRSHPEQGRCPRG
jgi:hypothetical protein